MGYNETLKAAIDKYSPVMQSIVAMEEMGELIQEISKDLRGKGNVQKMAEEIADVEIMLDQLKIMHGCGDEVWEWRRHKVNRLRDNLKGA